MAFSLEKGWDALATAALQGLDRQLPGLVYHTAKEGDAKAVTAMKM